MMFCNQCEETLGGKGCVKAGVCGKSGEVADLQDLLIRTLSEIAGANSYLRKDGKPSKEAEVFITTRLFSTITNANFDDEHFYREIRSALILREKLRAQSGIARKADLTPDADASEILTASRAAGLTGVGDIRSLKELLLYGIKGISAYAEHALALGKTDEEVFSFMEQGLTAAFSEDMPADELLGLVMTCGEKGVSVMKLLDSANTGTYGEQEPTNVSISVGNKPGILVSGHDLLDLEELLIQSEGKGLDIYTHGEMLPANSYPKLKRFSHLKGNYGGSWWLQGTEFESFNGPIILTTNCLIPPKGEYKGRLYTTGSAGFSGVPHIPDRTAGGQKDFTPIIAQAQGCEPPKGLEEGSITGGYARATLTSALPSLIALVKAGKIRRFVVMAGCDGRDKDRSYYTEFAKAFPKDTVILTAGCAKFRYNKLGLGEIEGIPRVVDAGQCNDSYSLIVAAQALAKELGCGVNDLPISYNIAWYEQKAVLVLLALLSLGVKGIRLGPKLPAFVSPGVLSVLIEKFGIAKNADVESDMVALFPS